MKLINLLTKYGLSDNDLDLIALSVMEGKGLIETTKSLSKDIEAEKVYVVAKEFCKIEFGLPLDEFSPQFVLDRLDIQEGKLLDNQHDSVTKAQTKKFKQVNEDLMYLTLELQSKAA